MKAVANVVKGENVVGQVWEASDKLGRPVYNWEVGDSNPIADLADIHYWPQSVQAVEAGLPRGFKVVSF